MKKFTEIAAPDERQRLFAGSLRHLHTELAAIRLNEAVPEKVRDLLDTALNVSLYSWFVYDFHPVADLTGFLAMEAAFRARASLENDAFTERPLKVLLKHAIKEGWVVEDRIAGRREIARARVQHRKRAEAIERADAAGATSAPIEEPTEDEVSAEAQSMRIIEAMCIAGVDLRNALAHGERVLVPGSHDRLRTMADLINQLFPATAACDTKQE